MTDAIAHAYHGTTAAPLLTSLSPAGGCGAKACPADLATMTAGILRPSIFEGILIDSATSDDAVVVDLPPGFAAATLDVMTPIHDVVEIWGEIVAANVLSDLFAEGSRPLFALDLLIWPPGRSLSEAARLLQSARDALEREGAALLGGHTLAAGEVPFFGMAAFGTLDGLAPTLNSTAVVGDLLILTKPLGIGIAVTAAKAGICPADLHAEATETMRQMNSTAALGARTFSASAVTDVTGFGLTGHVLEMAKGSGVTVEIWADEVPVLDGVSALIACGVETSGGSRNRRDLMGDVSSKVDAATEVLLADPQTSGGLLIAVAPARAGELIEFLGAPTAVIGQVAVVGDKPLIIKERK